MSVFDKSFWIEKRKKKSYRKASGTMATGSADKSRLGRSTEGKCGHRLGKVFRPFTGTEGPGKPRTRRVGGPLLYSNLTRPLPTRTTTFFGCRANQDGISEYCFWWAARLTY